MTTAQPAGGAGDVRAIIDEKALNEYLASIPEIATPVTVKQFQVRLSTIFYV